MSTEKTWRRNPRGGENQMEIKPGMKVRVIADSFKADPHEVPIGSELVVRSTYPSVKVEDMNQAEMYIVMENFGEVVDLPARIYVEDIPGIHMFALIPVQDVEVIDSSTSAFYDPENFLSSYGHITLSDDSFWNEDWADEDWDDCTEEEEPEEFIKIEMLQDDYFEGYVKGDIFDAEYDEDHGSYIFTDHDGDLRQLDDAGQHKFKIL